MPPHIRKIGRFVKVQEFDRPYSLRDLKDPHSNKPDIWTEEALKHSAAVVRQEAVKAFGEYSAPESFKILKHHAENDKRFEVRGTAISGIANLFLKDSRLRKYIPRVARYLMTFLNPEKEKSVLVRIDTLRSINALIEKAPELAEEFLFEFTQRIRTEDNVYMKNILLRSIALSKDETSLRYVTGYLKDKNAFVRYGAILAVLDIKKNVFEDIKLLYEGENKSLKKSKRSQKLAIKAACEYYAKLKTLEAKKQVLDFFNKIFSSQTISFELYEFAFDMFIGFDLNSKRKLRSMGYIRGYIESFPDTLSQFIDVKILLELKNRYYELKEFDERQKEKRKEEQLFKTAKKYAEDRLENIMSGSEKLTVLEIKQKVIEILNTLLDIFDGLTYRMLFKMGFSLKLIAEASDYDISGFKDSKFTLKELLDADIPLNELVRFFNKKEFLDLGLSEEQLASLNFD